MPGQVGRRPSGEDRRSQPHQLSEIQLCRSGGLGIVFRGAGEVLLGPGDVGSTVDQMSTMAKWCKGKNIRKARMK